MILYACFLKSGKKAVLFFSAISLLQSFLRLLIGLKLCLRPKQYLIYTKRSTVSRPVMTHLVYQPGTAWFEYRIIVFCHNRQISRHLVILMKHEHSVSIVAFLLLASSATSQGTVQAYRLRVLCSEDFISSCSTAPLWLLSSHCWPGSFMYL
jgi:hypothetical protein